MPETTTVKTYYLTYNIQKLDLTYLVYNEKYEVTKYYIENIKDKIKLSDLVRKRFPNMSKEKKIFKNISGQLLKIKSNKSAPKLYCPDCWESDNIESCPNDKCLMKVLNEYFTVSYKNNSETEIPKYDDKVKVYIFKKAIDKITGEFFLNSVDYEQNKQQKEKQKKGICE